MARLRPLTQYPAKFLSLFKQSLEEPTVLKFPTSRFAESFRLSLYNYRTALRLEAETNLNAELAADALLIDSITITRLNKALIIHNQNGDSFL